MHPIQVSFNTKVIQKERVEFLKTTFQIFLQENNHSKSIGNGFLTTIDFQNNKAQDINQYKYTDSSLMDIDEMLDYFNVSPSIFEQRYLKPAPSLSINDIYGKVSILHTFFIDTSYRNQGYGKKTMQQILDYLKLIGTDFVILQPYPLDDEYIFTDISDMDLKPELQNSVSRLIKFYNLFGFNLVQEQDVIYMVLNMKNHTKQIAAAY